MAASRTTTGDRGSAEQAAPAARGAGARAWQASANLFGESAHFIASVDVAAKLSSCDVTTLIQGETGTGKELIARAMHYLGRRAAGPFVPVNCGALPESLVESELFGHARGAYTDAREAYSGLIAQAEGGTLFLDEVETMSQPTQVKLLRFLQDLQYRPVGSSVVRTANVRVIAATNANLGQLVARGAWRGDLLFRLRVVPLEIPPLRARGRDVLLLARRFSEHFAERYATPVREVCGESVPWLLSYDWPGNVRELENLVHREFLLQPGPLLRLGPDAPAASAGAGGPRALTEQPFREAKAKFIRQFERAYLEELLERVCGNLSAASRLCGKERRDLSRLVRKHGLSPAPDRAAVPSV